MLRINFEQYFYEGYECTGTHIAHTYHIAGWFFYCLWIAAVILGRLKLAIRVECRHIAFDVHNVCIVIDYDRRKTKHPGIRWNGFTESLELALRHSDSSTAGRCHSRNINESFESLKETNMSIIPNRVRIK